MFRVRGCVSFRSDAPEYHTLRNIIIGKVAWQNLVRRPADSKIQQSSEKRWFAKPSPCFYNGSFIGAGGGGAE